MLHSDRITAAVIAVLRRLPREELELARQESHAVDLLDDLCGYTRKKKFEVADLEPALEEIREAFEDEDCDVDDLRRSGCKLQGGMALAMVQAIFRGVWFGDQTELFSWAKES